MVNVDTFSPHKCRRATGSRTPPTERDRRRSWRGVGGRVIAGLDGKA